MRLRPPQPISPHDARNPTHRTPRALRFALPLRVACHVARSVFNGPEITMHKDNLHAGGVEHRDVHNLYGYYYHMASAEGLKRRGFKVHGQDGDRPFVLSRAFFAGTQRVGPIWTGDNAADWDHLRVSVPMLLTLGVSGLPFSGADVGGFFGNPDTELLTRWYQVGAYYPFFRGHAHLETQRREPWLFGEPHTSRIRTAIRSRYALMPYLYTLFRFANTSGAPVMRPLWYEFPDNAATFGTQEEFMLGGAILVRPVLTAGASSVAALLPRGQRWYDVASGAEVKPGSGKSSWLGGAGDQQVNVPVTMDAIPAFYRGGSVVPRKERPRRSTTTMERDPYTLIVALDANGAASGSLYLDDGCSFAFARGEYMHRAFTFRDMTLTARRLTELRVPTGEVRAVPKFSTPNKVERIVLLGLPSASGYTATIRVDGGGETVALTQGAALPSAPAATHAWVLRKPDLPIGGDWTVEIKRV